MSLDDNQNANSEKTGASADAIDAAAIHRKETQAPVPPAAEEVSMQFDNEVQASHDSENTDGEEFESLIGSYLDNMPQHEKDSIIEVQVVKIAGDSVLVDLGDKAEGVVPLQEFMDSKGVARVAEGDRIAVQVVERDEESGLVIVSHRRARHQGAIIHLRDAYAKGLPLTGRVTRKIKGGLMVDVGVECFMPASQVSDRRVENLDEWVDREIEAVIIELDERKNRAVLSRRKLVEEKKRADLQEALGKVTEGETVEAKVKSVMNFGAFLDVHGLDAFLPREEMSWDRGMTPENLLKPEDTIQVKLLQVDQETGRIRVSRKALLPDPWENIDTRYPVETMVNGEVATVTRYGAFVRIEEGLTGLIHVTDMSWAKGPQKVTDYVKEGDSVQAVVLGVDKEQRRLSLGLKQLLEDPWEEAEKQFPKGSKVKGVITSLAPFGAFVKLNDEIEGLVHISEIDWENHYKHPSEVYKVGQEIEAVVLKSDRQTRRISLGVKQLTESPMQRSLRELKVGAEVEAEVVRMIPTGAFLSLAPRIDGFLPVSQMDIERTEKPESLFKIGDKVKCKIIKVEKVRGSAKISLSRKALLETEQRRAIKEYQAGAKDTGVMKLGELLGKIKLNPSPEDQDSKPEA
jgi:small subunit ribosomal protein S1